MMRALMAVAAALALAPVLAACAGQPVGVEEGANTPAARGRAFAELRCAACHAIGPTGESARTGAPPFRTLRVRFNEISWERTMAQIASGGHESMPPVSVEPGDVRDLQAFIRTLP